MFPTLDRRIWILAAARLVVTAGFSVVMPFLAMHLVVEKHVPLLHIGILWTVVGATSASMQWVAGWASDRVGRRPLLVTAMAMRSVNLAAMGLAVGTDASLVVLGALCMVNGAMRAFYDPVASAVVASVAGSETRVAAFSLQRVGSSLGWAIGPFCATLLSDLPYSTLFYACAPLTLIAAAAVATIPEPPANAAPPKTSRKGVPNLRAARGDRTFKRFLLATAAFYLLQTQMYHIMSIYAAKTLDLDRAQVGTLFTINGILVVLFQLPAVRVIRSVGHKGSLVLGSLGYMVAYAGCGLAVGYLSLVLCVALITMSEIVAAPAQQSTAVFLAPRGKVAEYAGLLGLVQGAAQTAGPVIGTGLIALLSARSAWFALAGLGLLAALVYSIKRDPTDAGFSQTETNAVVR